MVGCTAGKSLKSRLTVRARRAGLTPCLIIPHVATLAGFNQGQVGGLFDREANEALPGSRREQTGKPNSLRLYRSHLRGARAGTHETEAGLKVLAGSRKSRTNSDSILCRSGVLQDFYPLTSNLQLHPA